MEKLANNYQSVLVADSNEKRRHVLLEFLEVSRYRVTSNLSLPEDLFAHVKSVKPDIIFIDYLNICASSRFKGATNVNSYMYIKAIAEELRGLAVEINVPIMSATQTTRSGYSNSDIGLEDTSESFGLPATADFMFALISNEELDELNQIAVKQLKNRYNDPTINKRFVIGIDRAKMKLFDISQNEQNDLADSGQDDDLPVFDKSSFGYDGFSV